MSSLMVMSIVVGDERICIAVIIVIHFYGACVVFVLLRKSSQVD